VIFDVVDKISPQVLVYFQLKKARARYCTLEYANPCSDPHFAFICAESTTGKLTIIQDSEKHVETRIFGDVFATSAITSAPAVLVWQPGFCIDWAITNLAGPSQREESRTREPQAIARPQRWIGRTDEDARREACNIIRWNRGYVVLLFYRSRLMAIAVATILCNWHNVLRAISMASSTSYTHMYMCGQANLIAVKIPKPKAEDGEVGQKTPEAESSLPQTLVRIPTEHAPMLQSSATGGE